jgi:uncharacterized protein YndB with AHSA1/START domain
MTADAATLATRAQETERTLVITRTFKAPRRLVFKAWTDPAHAARWWGPKGFTAPDVKLEVRPGGSHRACLKAPDGSEHWFCGVYQEVKEAERLVFSFAWEDADGQPGHQTLVSIDLVEAPDGTTRMTFRQEPFATVESRDSHEDGWTQSFDRLEALLAGERADAPASRDAGRPA